MAVRSSQSHTELDTLREAIAALDRRVTALEHATTVDTGTIAATGVGARFLENESRPLLSENESRPRLLAAFALAGRAFLAFGGAFVLRALTEAGTVGPAAGAWLGITYALAWLAAAARTSGPSRLVNGWLTLAIGLPLVLEAAGRLRLLSPGAGLAALMLVAGLPLLLAWRQGLPSLAAGAALGGALVGVGLGFSIGHVLWFAALNVLLGVGALWVSWHREWTWLAWLSAAVTNLSVLLAAARAFVRPPPEPPLGAEVVLAGFGVAYLGSVVLRTLLHERSVRLFEVAQTVAVLLIGFGGAILIARTNGFSLMAIGAPAAIAGVALYAQSFMRVAARRGYGADFQYYGFLAFSLVLAGATVLLPGWMLPSVTSLAALALVALASALGQTPLMLQAAMALVVAAVESGLLRLIVSCWTSRLDAWPSVGWAPAGVLAAAAICYAAPPAARLERDAFSMAARVALGGLVAGGLACGLLLAIGPTIAGRPPAEGVLATVRTIIVTGSAVLLAWVGGLTARRELVWIAYVALAFGGVKVLFEDLARSQASTLFMALVAYGVALMVTPRLTSGSWRNRASASASASAQSRGGR
jgi:hypothetical protein